MLSPRTLAALLLIPALATPLAAQWSDDPALNQTVAESASDQTQPKIAATASGGAYLSWFDGIGNGFDVRVQRLDADGTPLFPAAGVLVADRGFSSTQDYALDVDAAGNALLAFRDDRGVGIQITAAKISSAGVAAWGASGVQLTSTGAFVAAPKITGTSDGGAVVAWTQGSSTRVQKLDANGVTQWVSDVVLTPAGGSHSASDLHATGNNAILSFVHQTGGFGSPRRLRAQKFDALGNSLWGATWVDVFDAGSLQFGNFPRFVPDGSGGAVFSWYDTAGAQLQCYAQHLRPNGGALFGHNGVAVSTNATRIRVSPTASYDANTGATVVSWVEQNAGQSQWGLYSQKIDATGARLWGAEGSAHIPLGSTPIGLVSNLSSADASFVFWAEQLAVGDERIRGLRADPSGATDIGPLDVSTPTSAKSRLVATSSAVGHGLLAWMDDRVDSGGIYAQNANCDGSLGAPSLSAGWTDLGFGLIGFAGVPVLTGSGTLCSGDDYSVSLSQARPSSPVALVLGFTQINSPLKGGVLVPAPDLISFGLATNGAGEVNLLSVWPSTLPTAFDVYAQMWITDAAAPVGFAASNGLKISTP